jgi:comEA protein
MEGSMRSVLFAIVTLMAMVLAAPSPAAAQAPKAAKPAQAANTAKPAQPVNAAKPAHTARAAKPAQTAKAAKPAQTAKAAAPTQTEKAAKPATTAKAAKPASTAKARATAANPINLNAASVAQLQTLPGIGASAAQRIVEYRQKNGAFKKIEELMNVKGIGEKSFLKLKPLITVGAEKADRAGAEK